MILVDTSVFINYFKGVENESTLKLDKILSENITFGINNFIFQELLQGSSNENEFNTLFKYLTVQTFYSLKG
jgi:predicted nucleic acid-binding protein